MNTLLKRLLAAVFAISILACAAAAEEDFASQLTFNPLSETAKVEATVKTFVDGDTVHFHVPHSVSENGVLKARFLAINTPEITGKVEEYGMQAALFTKEKLSGASSIMLESDDSRWNLDSTGDRHLVWVWYKSSDSQPYRCLNIEILQNGLAKGNSTANNRYGTLASAALDDAKKQKRKLYSGQPDPDFYYGDAIELTLKELRMHAPEYTGKKVAFKGIVTLNDGNSVYVEDYDAETGQTFGMSVYYGYDLSGKGLSILTPGNEVRIVGSMQYYEAGGTYQVSDLTYRAMKPNDPGNIQKLSDGHAPAYLAMDAQVFQDRAGQALGTTVTVDGLTVISAKHADGAVKLECAAGDSNIRVYVVSGLQDSESLLGKTIQIKGIVDFFEGSYQVKVFYDNAITIID